VGSLLYDFLNESVLYQESSLSDNYRTLSEAELRAELEKYRTYVVSNIGELLEEIAESQGGIQLYSPNAINDIPSLTQFAFYLDRIVLPDPIFPFTEPRSDIADSFKKFMGGEEEDHVNREELAAAVRLVRQVTPMAAFGYLKFFPASLFVERPREIPIVSPVAELKLVMPAETLDVYLNSVKVRLLRKEGHSFFDDEKLSISRYIAIDLGDEKFSYMYTLMEQRVLEMDEATRTARFSLSLPENDVSAGAFEAWVAQSKRQAVLDHYSKLRTDIQLSVACKSMLLTGSAFSSAVLQSGGESRPNVARDVANAVVSLDVPFFREVDTVALMRARQDAEAFSLFRRELEKQLRDLRLETDPAKLALKSQNALHELTEVQLTKVGQSIPGIRRKFLGEAAMVATAALTSTVNLGLSVLGSAYAAASAFKSYSDYRKSVRENPAYFLWKVKKG
jgi:hypothetical protein